MNAFEAHDGRVRWVHGSMGAGTRLLSLGHTTHANLKSTFAEQALGLIRGGIETFEAIRQIKGQYPGIHATLGV